MTAITDIQLAEDVNAIKALIQAFFDAINAEDTKALQSKFLPKANLTIIRQDPPLPPGHHHHHHHAAGTTQENGEREEKEGEDEEETEEKLTVVIRTSVEDFIRLVEDGQKRRKGRPGRQPVLRETPDLGAAEVRVDGLFGAAWSPFEVTFDGVLHHYGTMAYTLGRVGGAGADGDGEGKVWRVEGLTQSYRRTPGWAAGEEGLGVY